MNIRLENNRINLNDGYKSQANLEDTYAEGEI